MTQLMRQFHGGALEPFDILFRNFFDADTFFSPLADTKPKYPIDIYENDNGLQFDVAVVGFCEKDINIEVTDGDILRISYEKEDQNEDYKEYGPSDKNYIHQGIAKRSFNFGWKISNKFDLKDISATIENGLLSIHIPHAEEAKPKKITIKPSKAIKSKN
jgi:HSP20 family molecular chaperone IbpA